MLSQYPRDFASYSRGLDALSKKVKSSAVDLPIESVSLSLQDLIGYFHPPDEHLEHEDKQNRLRALKNRQNLFQEEVVNCFTLLFATFCLQVFFHGICVSNRVCFQWFLFYRSQNICYVYNLLRSVDFTIYLRKYI